jgi:hypothetical protein
VLAHLENVGQLLEQVLAIAELTRLEVHGPKAELAQLREPLKAPGPLPAVIRWRRGRGSPIGCDFIPKRSA